ncbi:P-loop containing nucleoside triphosphate hydrolase [Glarea lozoyensis ATCC 20868]|uniref:p-loop containing nucleoside triphosphate hydrolase n=1 Tax=Glarea lozoyensis (strain ATCC 20868 / MF5171) TaxID=1116229 RepID=S3DF25_GLAL2|nr:P-loop containing nucleoside triphosphate hydrolase [Glarea lozoyensis ATCC 20868]EPE37017.1 P-loop containing nucleoside triphosphate hydrolase [Glarea lozoyensis ATCC 20868]
MAIQQSTPHTKLFIQMSGRPGSGKSTLSRLLRSSINGVVIDHDILRSPLLESNIPFNQAAKLAYTQQWRLAEDFAKQGVENIIIDSPCNYQEVLEQGSTCAKRFGYTFWYIECQIEDAEMLERRLQNREPMTSQRTGIEAPPAAVLGGCVDEDAREVLRKWTKVPCRPDENTVLVDSAGDLVVLRDYILQQIV